jgi:hypothetical protein
MRELLGPQSTGLPCCAEDNSTKASACWAMLEGIHDTSSGQPLQGARHEGPDGSQTVCTPGSPLCGTSRG